MVSLLNADGQAQAVFGLLDPGPVLLVRSADGNATAGMHIASDGPVIGMDGPGGQRQIQLEVGEEGPAISLNSRSDDGARIFLGLNEEDESAHVLVFGTEDTPRAFLGLSGHLANVALFDPDGQMRVVSGAQEGNAYLKMYDAEGETEIWSAP